MTFSDTDWSSLITFGFTLVGGPIALWQLWRIQRTNRNTSIARLYDGSTKIREYFLERPDLRKYFYDNEQIAEDHKDYGYVVTLAEIILNFQEHKTLLKGELGKDWKAWKAGRDSQIKNSPIMRDLIRKNPDKYVGDFVKAARLH